jgi:hypothetical protein
MPQIREEAFDDLVRAASVRDTGAGRIARRAVAARDGDRSRRSVARVQQAIKRARGGEVLLSVSGITGRVVAEAYRGRILVGAAVGPHIDVILRARRAVPVVGTRMSSNGADHVSATAGQSCDVIAAPRKPGGKHSAFVDAVGGFHGRDHVIEERHIVSAAGVVPADAVIFVINSLRKNEDRRGARSRRVLNPVVNGVGFASASAVIGERQSERSRRIVVRGYHHLEITSRSVAVSRGELKGSCFFAREPAA